MNSKVAGIFLIVCIVLFVVIGVRIGLRNLSFFDIKDIEITCNGPVSEVSDDMYRCISPYKGVNIFKAKLDALQHSVMQFEGVESVEIEKFYPNKLIITVDYVHYAARVSFEENSVKYFFLTDGKSLDEVSEETFGVFSSLAEVRLEPSYAYFILRWGTDNGFAQMCNLVEELGRKNLNSIIKYDNNNSDNFGLLTVETDNPNVIFSIREPVTPQRLSDALDVIIRESGSSKEKNLYDLYSTALVKRHGGGVHGI